MLVRSPESPPEIFGDLERELTGEALSPENCARDRARDCQADADAAGPPALREAIPRKGTRAPQKLHLARGNLDPLPSSHLHSPVLTNGGQTQS